MNLARRLCLCTLWCAAALAPGACDEPLQKHASTANPAKAPITWLVPMQLDRPLLERLAIDFRASNPDIDLKLVFVPGAQYQTKLKTLIAAGQAPDMFYCGDVWVAYCLPFLLDLSPLFARDAAEIRLDDIYPEVMNACAWEGRYLFVPRWFSVALLYYNRRLFDEAHEPYPRADWTWDEYIAAAKRLTKKDANGRTVVWGSQIVTGWWGEWLTLVRQAGGEIFDPEFKRCLLDEPAAMRGMRTYADKVRKHHISPPPGFAPDQGFASGKLAMELVGHTGNWTMFNQIPNFDWDIQLLPAGPTKRNRSEVALDAIGVSKATREPEACWRFLKFMMSKPSIRAHVDAGYLSIRKSVAQETFLAPGRTQKPVHADVAYEALRISDHVPCGPDFIEVTLEVIQPEIDRALIEGNDVDECCRRATRAANDFLETLGTQRKSDAAAARSK